MSEGAAHPRRRPYAGSCHCGAVKYVVYLTMPHVPPNPPNARNPDGSRPQRIYRCNCTTCQKAGLMHVRPASPPDDFLVLSPLDPLRELGDYLCFDRGLHFLFCKGCGVRCFTFAGEGELLEQEGAISTPGEKRVAWCPKRGQVEDVDSYLSVNGYTIDAGQEGLDLREWTEKKWVLYLDCLTDLPDGPEPTYERPFPGGAY